MEELLTVIQDSERNATYRKETKSACSNAVALVRGSVDSTPRPIVCIYQ